MRGDGEAHPGPILDDDAGAVRLRPLDPRRDAPRALRWYADPEVLEGSEGRGTRAYDLATLERMYRHLADRGEVFLIEVRAGEGWRTVGDAALCPETCPVVIGDADARGRGVGRTVLALLVRRARALGWEALRVRAIYAYNTRSAALYEGAGFRAVGSGTDAHGRPYRSYRLDLGAPPADADRESPGPV